jgi:hypothetical protein
LSLSDFTALGRPEVEREAVLARQRREQGRPLPVIEANQDAAWIELAKLMRHYRAKSIADLDIPMERIERFARMLLYLPPQHVSGALLAGPVRKRRPALG